MSSLNVFIPENSQDVEWEEAEVKTNCDISEVCDGLFIGSVRCTTRPEVLLAKGIVCAVDASQRPNSLPGIDVLVVNLKDDDSCSPAELHATLQQCHEFMTAAVEARKPLFVFCHRGISRSAMILASFIMARDSLTAAVAIQRVKSRRAVVGPNLYFLKQMYVFAKSGWRWDVATAQYDALVEDYEASVHDAAVSFPVTPAVSTPDSDAAPLKKNNPPIREQLLVESLPISPTYVESLPHSEKSVWIHKPVPPPSRLVGPPKPSAVFCGSLPRPRESSTYTERMIRGNENMKVGARFISRNRQSDATTLPSLTDWNKQTAIIDCGNDNMRRGNTATAPRRGISQIDHRKADIDKFSLLNKGRPRAAVMAETQRHKMNLQYVLFNATPRLQDEVYHEVRRLCEAMPKGKRNK